MKYRLYATTDYDDPSDIVQYLSAKGLHIIVEDNMDPEIPTWIWPYSIIFDSVDDIYKLYECIGRYIITEFNNIPLIEIYNDYRE